MGPAPNFEWHSGISCPHGCQCKQAALCCHKVEGLQVAKCWQGDQCRRLREPATNLATFRDIWVRRGVRIPAGRRRRSRRTPPSCGLPRRKGRSWRGRSVRGASRCGRILWGCWARRKGSVVWKERVNYFKESVLKIDLWLRQLF